MPVEGEKKQTPNVPPASLPYGQASQPVKLVVIHDGSVAHSIHPSRLMGF
jgi:hypothetical protein